MQPSEAPNIRRSPVEHERDLSEGGPCIGREPTEVEKLQAEIDILTKGGIIEVAVRNPNVSEYIEHWETRAQKAEAEVARLRDIQQWDFYPIEMPITASGHGPATVGFDASRVTYEVWDRLCHAHASFDNLPDAINDAMDRTRAALAQGEQP